MISVVTDASNFQNFKTPAFNVIDCILNETNFYCLSKFDLKNLNRLKRFQTYLLFIYVNIQRICKFDISKEQTTQPPKIVQKYTKKKVLIQP